MISKPWQLCKHRHFARTDRAPVFVFSDWSQAEQISSYHLQDPQITGNMRDLQTGKDNKKHVTTFCCLLCWLSSGFLTGFPHFHEKWVKGHSSPLPVCVCLCPMKHWIWLNCTVGPARDDAGNHEMYVKSIRFVCVETGVEQRPQRLQIAVPLEPLCKLTQMFDLTTHHFLK